MKPRDFVLFTASLVLLAGDSKLPLPPAPLRMVIPDVALFDTALTGGYQQFLNGEPKAGDPVVSAWRKTQVGSKLEDQWSKFAESLPLNWADIKKLQPRSLGLALLQVGHLEAVLILETPLAVIPLELPAGEKKTHGGIPYSMVVKGAADASEDPDRRMGFAWARSGSFLFLATSERALKLALDEALGGRGIAAPMPGLIAMELDLDVLRKDRYFRREFLFPEGPETGKLRTALRKEGGHLIEVREGTNEPRNAVFTFESPNAATAGWEPEGTVFWPAFRRGLLEPIPVLLDQPVATVRPLPAATTAATEDRYLTDFTRPKMAEGSSPWEEGDLATWKALLQRTPIASWGFWVGSDGIRRMVFPWPEAQDGAFLETCRATVVRRTGRTTAVKEGDAQELRVGPNLPALAIRRTGGFLWVGPSAKALQSVLTPAPGGDLIRWTRVNLTAVRKEAGRWAKVEGPARPEQVRPLSDRVLGLLGWMPTTTSISVERRKTASGWTEKIVFDSPGK
ncbi:MAG: hypothetical protein Q8O00_05510 [Holophaga sp.]|nr:hypothetical protein [Holophaga sp.]